MRGFLGRAGHTLSRVLATFGLGAASPPAPVVVHVQACGHADTGALVDVAAGSAPYVNATGASAAMIGACATTEAC